MPTYKIRDPDYVGFWTAKEDSKSSVLMIYTSDRISGGNRSLESGKMLDSLGIARISAVREPDSLRLSITYLPNHSGGRSDRIECEAKIDGDFVKGNWRSKIARGEFAAAKFGNAFLCNNPSMRLLFENEYNKLFTKLEDLTKEFPFSPPIPEALVESRES